MFLFGCVESLQGENKDNETTLNPDEGCVGCADGGAMPGSDRDEHGCIPSAGYSWCEVKDKCLRAWEEPCVEGSITLDEAKAIALDSVCVEQGNITDEYSYNNITHTWWFETNIIKAGCDPACVVNELSRTAEINWRCTGLIITENKTTTENKTHATPGTCIGPNEYEYDILVQNKTTSRGHDYWDTCVIAKSVKDYYCKNGELKDINTECPSGYDCRNGACKQMDYSCTKTSGKDTTLRGHITVVKGLTVVLDEYDECINDGTVKEWVCAENNTGYYEETDCGSGLKCGDGRCVRSKCEETDAGDDPLHSGKITFKDKDDSYEDFCVSDKTLREYYCYGDGINVKDYRCKNDKCDNDECVPDPENQ